MAGSVTHGGTLPDSAAKSDFYALIDNASLSSIADADIAAGAAIAATKLDLTNISSNMTYNASYKPKRTIILTAAGATVPTVAGAEQAQTDGTNVSYWTLNYDNGGSQADELAYWTFQMPNSYDDSDITVTVYYKPADGSTAGDTVRFVASMHDVAANLGESIDAAPGNATDISDVILNATPNDELHASPTTTMSAPAANGDLVIFKLMRDTSEDNMTEDAMVFFVRLEWAKDQDTD